MQTDLRHADYFLYTQFSLATFERCPLKFKKRYLENLKWESIPDKEAGEKIKRGMDFHLLASRYFMGIDDGVEMAGRNAHELMAWMKNLKDSFPVNSENKYLPEYKIRMSQGVLKLEANIDLVVIKPYKVEIWDWKTHGQNQKSMSNVYKNMLINSLQTMVYLFVAGEQIERIAGGNYKRSDISIYYWQPDPPGIICSIDYSDELHEQYREELVKKIQEIQNYDYADFDKELYKEHCRYCEFNWFCNNERVDYRAIEEDTDFLEELDWEEIEELY